MLTQNTPRLSCSATISNGEFRLGRGASFPRRIEAEKRLNAGNALSLQALRALLYFELHQLAFIERLVPVHLNGRKVNEDVLAGLALNESVSLGRIEPLHHTLFSCQIWTPLFRWNARGRARAGDSPRIAMQASNRSPATQGRQAAGFYLKKSSPVQKMSQQTGRVGDLNFLDCGTSDRNLK